MSGLSTRDFGTREDSVPADSEQENLTAMQRFIGMHIVLEEVRDAVSDLIAATGAPVSLASVTSLASTASSQQLLAATANRRGLILVNTDEFDAYIKYGLTASATDFTDIVRANSRWTMPEPIFTGRVDIIWAGDGAGKMFMTELA